MNIKGNKLVSEDAERHILDTMGLRHVRVAVVGNVDAGKSTLIGTLASGKLDNGRGLSRASVLKHKHELESGRTSSISTHLLGFQPDGMLLNKDRMAMAEVVHKSDRVVTMMDLAGHEKYLKTTIAGVSRGMIDYSLVLVNAAQPPNHMTLHHLHLSISSGAPVIVLITKIDSCPKHVYKETKRLVADMLRAGDVGKKAFTVNNEHDIMTVRDKITSLAPVVSVSSVTGEGLDVLAKLLFMLPKRRHHEKKIDRPFEFLIEQMYNVPGVGAVLYGFVNAGNWEKGDPIYVGPLKDGTYIKTVAKSAHVAMTSVGKIWAGHSACLAVNLTKAQRRLLRKGGAILKEPVASTRRFEAEVCLMKGSATTFTKGRSETYVHILHVMQNARIIDFEVHRGAGLLGDRDDDVLRPGCRARVTFEFTHYPEYVRKGMRLLFRDGSVRGVGVVTKIVPEKSAD